MGDLLGAEASLPMATAFAESAVPSACFCFFGGPGAQVAADGVAKLGFDDKFRLDDAWLDTESSSTLAPVCPTPRGWSEEDLEPPPPLLKTSPSTSCSSVVALVFTNWAYFVHEHGSLRAPFIKNFFISYLKRKESVHLCHLKHAGHLMRRIRRNTSAKHIF